MNRGRYFLSQLLRCIYHRADVILYRFDLSAGSPNSIQPKKPVVIEPITLANVDKARTMEPAYRLDQFRQFLAWGDAGYFALHNGDVVHRSWVQFGPRLVQQHHQFAPYRLEAHEAYIHYCETHPSARGLGIYPAMLAHILRELKDRGIHGCYIATTSANLASRRGIEKVGFHPVQRTEIRVVLGKVRRTIHSLCDAS